MAEDEAVLPQPAAGPSRNEARRQRRVRRWSARVLALLSILLVVVSTVAVWTYRTALNTDRFMTAVEPALDDAEFYEALSNVVYEQALEALDLEERVSARLGQLDAYMSDALTDATGIGDRARRQLQRFDRPSIEALAVPVTVALEDRVKRIVDRVILSDVVQTQLPVLVRNAHAAAVELLRGDVTKRPNVYMADGQVRVNLIPIVANVLRQVVAEIRDFVPDVSVPDGMSNTAAAGREQLSEALGKRLPDDFGQVTVMSDADLSEVQHSVDRLDRFVWVIVIVTVVVIAATVAVSLQRRRTALQLGAGVVIGMLVGALVVGWLRQAIMDVIEDADGRGAAGALITQTITSLRTTALIVGAIALVVAVVVYLAGRPGWLRRES